MDARRVALPLAAVGAAALLYARAVRPRMVRWGATEQEVRGPFPGEDVVPGGRRGSTMAVTIDASPSAVWPWLLQLGGDRGGWYSWDRVDNGGHPSAQRLHPEWQDLAVGDTVKYWLNGRAVDAWRVAVLEPDRFLGLHGLSDLRGRPLDPDGPRPRAYAEGLWGFQLRPLAEGRTRLVVGGYEALRPHRLGRVFDYWVAVPVVWLMQSRMLWVLKYNIERAARVRVFASPQRGASPS